MGHNYRSCELRAKYYDIIIYSELVSARPYYVIYWPIVYQHKDTASPDKNCHQHQRVCCLLLSYMEQLTPWNFECCLAHSDFCATTKTLITYLSAATSAAEDFLFLRYICKCTRYYYYYYYVPDRTLTLLSHSTRFRGARQILANGHRYMSAPLDAL